MREVAARPGRRSLRVLGDTKGLGGTARVQDFSRATLAVAFEEDPLFGSLELIDLLESE
jgi:hypothetical protein